LNSLFAELKRRNIFRVAGAYVVVAWLTMQVISVMTPALNLPDWVDSFFAILFIASFPIALLFAWAFELTPNGMKRTESVHADDSIRGQTGRKLDFAILGGLGLVAALIIGTSLFSESTSSPDIQSTAIIEKEIPTVETGTSIAVLPFADMSAAGDQEYFSDGMAEEILNALVKVPKLRVAGRTSSFSFKGKDADIREIGQVLNVAHVLEGSVRKQGNNVRITTQLIKSEDGIHLWSETYDGTLDNIFELQESISRTVTGELKVVLELEEGERLVPELTSNQEAYEAYLRGRELHRRVWGDETLSQAIAQYERAIEIDPNFIEARVGLASALYLSPVYKTGLDDIEHLSITENAIDRLLALDPDNASARSILASVRTAQSDFKTAMDLRFESQRLGGDSHIGYIDSTDFSLGYDYAVIGQSRRAVELMERAVAQDPASGIALTQLGIAYFAIGNLDKAEVTLRQSEALGFPPAGTEVAHILYNRGQYDAAYAYALRAVTRMGDFIDGTISIEPSLIPVLGKAIFTIDPEATKISQKTMRELLSDPNLKINTTILKGLIDLQMVDEFLDEYSRNIFANRAFSLTHIWSDSEDARAIRLHPRFATWADNVGLVIAWQAYGWPDKCKPNVGTDGSDGQFTCT